MLSLLTGSDPIGAHEIGDCKVRQRDGSELQSCSRRMLLERLLGEKQFWPESNYGHEKII